MKPRYRTMAQLTWAGVAILLVLSACGNVLDLRSGIDRLVTTERFGGAFARLYGTAGNDEFNDALNIGDVLAIVGSTAAAGLEDGIVLTVASNGTINSQYRFAGTPDTGFTSAELIELGLFEGEQRLMVGGWNGSPTDGIVLRVRSDITDYFWASVFGGSTSNETVVDLATVQVDSANVGNTYAVGTTDAVVASGSPIHATFSSDGSRTSHQVLTSGSQLVPGGMVLSEDGDLVVAGTIYVGPGIGVPDISGLDVVVYKFDTETVVVARSINTGGGVEDHGWAIARISEPEQFIVVGSTNGYFAGSTSWLVLILDTDLNLEAAYAVKVNSDINGEARAVLALPEENYWSQPDIFAVAGDSYESVVMDVNGIAAYAVTKSGGSGILNGRATALATHADTYDGLYVVGTNQASVQAATGTEGAVLWSLPGGAASYPEMEQTTEDDPAVVGIITEFVSAASVSISTVPVPSPVSPTLVPGYFTATVSDIRQNSP